MPKAPPETKPIGRVTHYYGHLGVAIVKFTTKVPLHTTVRFHGATTDFEQALDSMQYDHKPIEAAEKGKEIGIKVSEKTREGDEVYKV